MNSSEHTGARAFSVSLFLSLLLVAVLCASNYMALFNEDFRQLFLRAPASEGVATTLSDRDKAQFALMATTLGVSAAELASNVRDLAEKHKKLVVEKERLSVDLANTRKNHQELSVKHQALEPAS